MGRSSRAQADENRARIVRAASDLFRAKGIEAVGIAEVMKAAGMTQGGFYKHFSSKEALAAEACTHAFATATERWREIAKNAARQGKSAAAAIAEHYAAPRPPNRTCPMIAFAPDAARCGPDDAMRQSFSDGVRALYETFAELGEGNGSPEADARLRTTFAAMVGSQMLAQSVQGPGWGHRGSSGDVSALGREALL